jgi:hypothetical protein
MTHDDADGESPSPDGTAPAKLFQKGDKKNGKGVPNSVNEAERDETDPHNDPSKLPYIFISRRQVLYSWNQSYLTDGDMSIKKSNLKMLKLTDKIVNFNRIFDP